MSRYFEKQVNQRDLSKSQHSFKSKWDFEWTMQKAKKCNSKYVR